MPSPGPSAPPRSSGSEPDEQQLPFATARPVVRPRRAVHVDLAEYGHAKVRHGLRPWQRTHRLHTVATDATAALLGLAAGLTVRTLVVGQDAALWGSPEATRATSVLIVVLWLLLLTRHGAYARGSSAAATRSTAPSLQAAAHPGRRRGVRLVRRSSSSSRGGCSSSPCRPCSPPR